MKHGNDNGWDPLEWFFEDDEDEVEDEKVQIPSVKRFVNHVHRRNLS
jgi:hypothetical protein